MRAKMDFYYQLMPYTKSSEFVASFNFCWF